YIEYFEKLGCKFIETSVSSRGTNPFKDLKLFSDYFKIINQLKPDIVLTFTIKPNVYGGIACRMKKIPTIVNITGLGTAIENKGILQIITLTLYKLAIKKSRCVFFQNKENCEFMTGKMKIGN